MRPELGPGDVGRARGASVPSTHRATDPNPDTPTLTAPSGLVAGGHRARRPSVGGAPSVAQRRPPGTRERASWTLVRSTVPSYRPTARWPARSAGQRSATGWPPNARRQSKATPTRARRRGGCKHAGQGLKPRGWTSDGPATSHGSLPAHPDLPTPRPRSGGHPATTAVGRCREGEQGSGDQEAAEHHRRCTHSPA